MKKEKTKELNKNSFAEEKGAVSLQEEAQKQKSRLTWEVKQKLIAVRKTRNITQREIGEATGMRTTNITRLERDDYDPSLEILERYARALGKTLEINLIDQQTGKIEKINEVLIECPQGEILDKGEKRILTYYRALSGKGKKMLTNTARDLEAIEADL